MSAEESTLQPVVETPAPAAAPEVAPASADTSASAPIKESRRETIMRAMKVEPVAPKPERQRGPDGKFATTSPQFPTPQQAQPIAQRPPMPKSLKLELQPHWDTAPEPLLAAINQREADYEKGVTPLKEKAKQADDLLSEFRPYEMLLKMENTTPQAAIGPLLQTAAILRTGTPAQKAHAVATTMRQFGIPLEHIQSILSGNAPPQPALDPQISQLHQQVQQLTQFQQQQQQARANRAISDFSADPAHKHFDAVAEHMTSLLRNPSVIPGFNDDMSEPEKLKLAYDTAIYANPEVRQLVLAEQQAAATVTQRTTQQVAQAKQAAVQVKGSPAAGPPPKADPTNRRAVLANAFSRFR